MKKIQALPFASTGLLLGIVALSNLMKNFIAMVSSILFVIAGCLFLAILIKIVTYPAELQLLLKQSLPTSSLPTLAMAMMLAGPRIPVFWYIGFIIHLGFMAYFTGLIWKKSRLDDLYPSWYIVYVGLAAGAIIAPQIGTGPLGWFCWIVGLISYLVLLPSVLYRLKKIPIPAANRLNLAILAAPASLLLLGALALKISWAILPLLCLSQIFYIGTIFLLRTTFQHPFSPTWSGMTFPSVSTATALFDSLAYLGNTQPALTALAYAEIIFATGIVGLVALHYLNYVYTKKGLS
ncbi:SLAC1 family transporter [Streptococcus gallinaceus]|uniref:Exfoliative toxin A/B n=1 Tax=Streptococcus gallinaceus TaxID=165758 RepID=A0ABV2JLD3_9STRE